MSDSELERTFKIQLHPIIDSIVIDNLDGETTAKEILDKYAAEIAKKFHCKESDIRDSLNHIMPFTPVKPAPDESARPSFIVLTHHFYIYRLWSWASRPSNSSAQEHVRGRTKQWRNQ